MSTDTPLKGKQTDQFWGLEAAYGTAPAAEEAWLRVPYYTSSLKPSESRDPDPILGVDRQNDRDPTRSAQGLPTHGGDVVYPLDLAVLTFLLKAAFGDPTTTGTDPNLVHVFTSASEELPSYACEHQIGRTSPLFFRHHGLVLSSLSLAIKREAGLRRASATWLGQKTTRPGSAARPEDLDALQAEQFAAAIGTVRLDGVALGSLMEATLKYDTGATPKEYVTGVPEISGVELGNDAACNGTLAIRFADATLYDLALANTDKPLEFEYQINANRLLKFALPLVNLAKTAPEVTGPGGIDAKFDFTAAQTASAPMITATLKTGTVAAP
jgi:hypothetical protein